MKKTIHSFYLLIFTILLISCGFSTQGEGEIGSKEIKLTNINQLSAKGSYRIIYLYDNQNPRMIIETYKNLIENLNINNAGGQLSISESRKVKDTDLYNIYIYNPEIKRFDIYNQVNVDINSPLRMSTLDIDLSDSAKLLANNLIVDQLTVKLSDDSKTNLQGRGSSLKLTVDDASNFSAPFFEFSTANVKIFNVAKVELNVKSKLVGRITDNAELTLIGNPAKDIKQEKLAQIKQKQ